MVNRARQRLRQPKALSTNNEDLFAGGFDAGFRMGTLKDSTLLQTKLEPYQMMICAIDVRLGEYGTPQSPSELNESRA